MLRAHVDAPGQPIRSSWALGWQILHVDGKDVIATVATSRAFTRWRPFLSRESLDLSS
jgi:hypothetical protein